MTNWRAARRGGRPGGTRGPKLSELRVEQQEFLCGTCGAVPGQGCLAKPGAVALWPKPHADRVHQHEAAQLKGIV